MAELDFVHNYNDTDLLLVAILCLVAAFITVLLCVACALLGRLQFGDQYDMVAQDARLLRDMRVVETE